MWSWYCSITVRQESNVTNICLIGCPSSCREVERAQNSSVWTIFFLFSKWFCHVSADIFLVRAVYACSEWGCYWLRSGSFVIEGRAPRVGTRSVRENRTVLITAPTTHVSTDIMHFFRVKSKVASLTLLAVEEGYIYIYICYYRSWNRFCFLSVFLFSFSIIPSYFLPSSHPDFLLCFNLYLPLYHSTFTSGPTIRSRTIPAFLHPYLSFDPPSVWILCNATFLIVSGWKSMFRWVACHHGVAHPEAEDGGKAFRYGG